MKVTLEKNYRSLYTLEDLERAKAVIAAEKEDLSTPAEWAEIAIREVLKTHNDHLNEVIRASAQTSQNYRKIA